MALMSGSCEDFCPQSEVKWRTHEKLLNFYELKDGQKNVPGTLVKSFARSAAGVKTPKPQDLRTEQCLRRCIEYLLKKIFTDKRKPFQFAYDFIFDRLRAVRQEMVMQQFSARKCIKLLEPIIMFLSYSRYRLCEKTVDTFDPKICDQHLQECLKRVLCCYDEIEISELSVQELRNRSFVEAVYQVYNLGCIEPLVRSTKLPKDVRQDANFRQAYAIALAYHQGNLYRVLMGISHLPHILCAVAALKLQIIRRKLLEIFSHAYNSKSCPVSANFVLELTLHHNLQDLFDHCIYYNVTIYNKPQLLLGFSKKDFRANLPAIPAKHEHFVEEKLNEVFIPDILLLKHL